MKKLLLAFAVIAFMGNAQLFAQDAPKTNQRPKLDMNELLEKRCQRMEAQLVLDDATAAKFAPIYKEYLQELRACHPHAGEYTKKCDRTDAERISNMEKSFDIRQKMLDTQKKYYNKLKNILNARQLETIFCSHKQLAQYRGKHGRHHCLDSDGMQRYRSRVNAEKCPLNEKH